MTFYLRFSLATLLTTIILLFSNTLYSQKNAIRATPLQPAIGKFSIDYERVVAARTTVMVEYQKWFERRNSSAGLFLLGIPAFSADQTEIRGYRMSFLVRQYTGAALNGAFGEGGFYLGRHDIITRTETTIANPSPDFIFDLFETTMEEEQYENVRVSGFRLGGGWQRTRGHFSLELSGGLNFNTVNSRGIRPTLGMKNVAPYTRFAIGVGF